MTQHIFLNDKIFYSFLSIFWLFGLGFQERCSLHSPACPGTHFIVQAVLKLWGPSACTSWVLRFKVCTTSNGLHHCSVEVCKLPIIPSGKIYDSRDVKISLHQRPGWHQQPSFHVSCFPLVPTTAHISAMLYILLIHFCKVCIRTQSNLLLFCFFGPKSSMMHHTIWDLNYNKSSSCTLWHLSHCFVHELSCLFNPQPSTGKVIIFHTIVDRKEGGRVLTEFY